MQERWSFSAVFKINHCLEKWFLINQGEKKPDRSQMNYRDIILPLWIQEQPSAWAKTRIVGSTQCSTKSHWEHTNRQLRSKLKQSHHYLSYSASPGVSWPLGNFLLNYTACRHLWSIITLSPSVMCCWDVKANSYRSNQSAFLPRNESLD